MYRLNPYGLAKYGEEKEREDSTKYFVDLTTYVPAFLSEIKELKQIYEIEGVELGSLKHETEDLLEQFFIHTATWGLVHWEQEYGIETNLEQSIETRREVILAKMRGAGTATKQMLKKTAEAFSGGEVEILEENGKYSFIVKFIGVKGVPRNMQAFIDMLEEMKPAHLTYHFEYTYSIWDNFKDQIWNQAAVTWNEMRTR